MGSSERGGGGRRERCFPNIVTSLQMLCTFTSKIAHMMFSIRCWRSIKVLNAKVVLKDALIGSADLFCAVLSAWWSFCPPHIKMASNLVSIFGVNGKLF